MVNKIQEITDLVDEKLDIGKYAQGDGPTTRDVIEVLIELKMIPARPPAWVWDQAIKWARHNRDAVGRDVLDSNFNPYREHKTVDVEDVEDSGPESIVCMDYPNCEREHAGGAGGVAVHPPAGSRISGDEPIPEREQPNPHRVENEISDRWYPR